MTDPREIGGQCNYGDTTPRLLSPPPSYSFYFAVKGNRVNLPLTSLEKT